ncbi:discoidin domain-containing protein [Haloferula sp. A504]|uniref:discoidin domain-containing protein n=1 Tax=Haloferula sp. A504 TaxID=3373601 RepID=UPI0031C0194F|nr:discoidin domain-containing protein [Verrucomicrobiaceae bacterium E54]
MKVKASLLALAVAFGTTGASPGELTSVLDWTGDSDNTGDSITTTTPAVVLEGAGTLGQPGAPDGTQLVNISNGIYDPEDPLSPSYVPAPDTPSGYSGGLQAYSFLSENVGSTTAGGNNDPAPVIIFDLGADTIISGYQIWNYRDGTFSSNMLEDYALSFATDAEGTASFGSSIADINGTASTANTDGLQSIAAVTARYIQFTLLSRHSGRKVGVEEIQFDLSAIGGPSADLALADFSYDPGDGSAEVSITGAANTNYKLVEADDLDFSNPDQDPIPLTGASVGTLNGNEVTTDGSGNATVQFNLGTAKSATFLRAEEVPE